MLVSAFLLMVFVSARADYTDREDVSAYIDELVRDMGFTRDELLGVFADAQRQQSIIDAMSRPAEKTLKWHEYRAIFLKDTTINQGVEFWEQHREALERAHSAYGVPPEYVLAIIGVETRFGRIMGRHRVVDALATLAFDYPPRAKFFRGQLTELLLLAREEGLDPLGLKGSYAGAMGYGQFIPSSFRSYAVDFDGDGTRNIWSSETDAIGSVANYFHRHGWRGGKPVVLQVQVPGGAAAQVDPLTNESLKLNRTVGELRALGVQIPQIDPSEPAALFRMELADGAEYWLGLNDFYVITRYNHSRLYALAVHQLSQAIKAARSSSALEAS
jgi:membrane-bound lytic murein transglycosylase B